MPGGGGPDIPEETTNIVRNVPYLESDINYGANQARDLYEQLLGGYRSRNQIYNDLKPQYTTQSTGGNMYVTPDGRVVDLAAGNQANIGSVDAQGQFWDIKDQLGLADKLYQAGDFESLEGMGYRTMGGGTAGGVDYEGLNAAVDAAYGDQDNAYSYYPNSTVVPFSQATEDALSLIEQRARNGSDLNRSAQQLTQDTIDGKYLNSNPYLDDVVGYTTSDITDRYLNEVLPSLNSTFASSGRFGSGAQALATGDATGEYLDSVGKASSDIRYQNYNDERNRQGIYAALAPSMAQIDYDDYGRLASVGSAREGLERQYLQEDIDRFYFDRDASSVLLDDYINRVTALNGGFGTSTSTGTNPAYGAQPQSGGIVGGLSGAATGLGLASTLASSGVIGGGATGALAGIGGPVGIGIAGLGLLGGLFG